MILSLKLATILISYCFISYVNCQTSCRAQNSPKRMVCYFNSWAASRPSPMNMAPENLDPCLCTHVLYSFVNMANNKLSLSTTDSNYFSRMVNWKSVNPNIKIIISVGGWNEGSTNFNLISGSDANSTTFCNSVVNALVQYNLDGLDIDWEYPSSKTQYTTLIKNCRSVFDQYATQNNRSKFLLSAAVAPDSGRMAVYDLPSLNNYFDFLNPMTYDWHGPWDQNPSHHSPLYGTEGSSQTLTLYINGGILPSKLNLGLAFYGRTTTTSGPYTLSQGSLAYFETCQTTSYYSYDQTIEAPNAFFNGERVFYDDVKSVTNKAKWAVGNSIGGCFTWDVTFDDFNNAKCGLGNFPLLNAAINVLSGNSTTTTTIATTATTATNTTTTIKTTTTTSSLKKGR